MTDAAPITDYERFLAALPENLREECKTKLTGSGLSANHPLFVAMAELYEEQKINPPRDFIEEAATHAALGQKLLDDFRLLPEAILARIEPQLVGLLKNLNEPVERLDVAATSLQRNVEALPILLLGDRPPNNEIPPPNESKPKAPRNLSGLRHEASRLTSEVTSTLANRAAWTVTGVITFLFWFAVSATVLVFGSAHLSRSYERAYQDRIARMESDSVTNTVTLNRLLALGLAVKVERGSTADDWFLIFQGAQKVIAPVDSPEGPAVEIRR